MSNEWPPSTVEHLAQADDVTLSETADGWIGFETPEEDPREIDLTVPPGTLESVGVGGGATDAEPTGHGDTHVELLVSAPGQLDQRQIPADATATIWVGANDETGLAPVGVSNETLDIDVTRPDGTVESFTVTTDADGNATRTYDLSTSTRGNGEYQFAVTDSDQTGESSSLGRWVGPDVVWTTQHGGDAFTGESVTFACLVHDGDAGLSGRSVDITVTDPDGTQVTQTTETTDADGYARVTFTPTKTGPHYELEATLANGAIDSQIFQAVPRLGKNTFDFAMGNPGSTNSFGALVDTPSGPLANTDLTVELLDSNGVFVQRSVTTDAGGIFVIDYDLPSNYSEDFLSVQAETSAGEPVPFHADFVNVTSPPPEQSSPVLTASAGSPRAPGETVTVDVQAEDDGTPITGQDVEVYLSFGDPGPPVYWDTVTTDSTGAASTSATIPSDAPDGISLDGTVAMQYGGSTRTAQTSTQIRRYQIQPNYPRPAPGTSQSYSIDVTETATGDPVQGVPVQLDLAYFFGEMGSFGTAGLESGTDGTDQTSISIPSDLGFRFYSTYLHRYRSVFSLLLSYGDHPGTLSTSDTLTIGQDAQFDFQTGNGTTMYGMVSGMTNDPERKSFGTRFQGPGTFTMTVPPELSDGDNLDLRVWGIDDTGTLYSERAFFSVESATIDLSATGESGVAVGGEATISINASNVASITIEDLWTDWSLASSSPDGGTLTDNIASAGEVTIDYGSVQSSVSPSITVGLPDRYVGGTYGIDVTATNGSGGSAAATATITIG